MNSRFEMIPLYLFYTYNRFIVLDEETIFQLKFNLWLLLDCSIAIFYFLIIMMMFLIAGFVSDARIHAATPAGGFFNKHY